MRNAKPVRLSCGCTRYYIIYPSVGEMIWCPTHESYEDVGNPDANRGRLYDEDFWSEPRGNKYIGGCAIDGCEYVTTALFANWHFLRDHMNKHTLREHTRFGTTLEIKEIAHDQPPF